MTTPIVYPTTLPMPVAAAIQSAERRALSTNPVEARALQRDRLAVEQITLPPFTPAQAAIFREWWETTLLRGGAWFAATWPLPQGLVAGVRRWIGTPHWEFVPGGFWRITGQCEVRGVGMLPTDGVDLCYIFQNSFGDSGCDIISIGVKGICRENNAGVVVDLFRFINGRVLPGGGPTQWNVQCDYQGDGFLNTNLENGGEVFLVGTGDCPDPACVKVPDYVLPT